MAIFIPRFLRHLRDVDTTGVADGDALTYDSGSDTWVPAAGGSGDLTDAVILAPASSARNVIQPTAGAVIAAIVKAHAAQSVDLTQWQKSDGTVLARVGPTGYLKISPTDISALEIPLWVVAPVGETRLAEFHDSTDSYGALFNTAGLLINGDGTSFGLSVGGPILSNVFTVQEFGGLARVRVDSNLILVARSTPADVVFIPSELGMWFDSTNGAAKFMLKGKTADGTVVTWTFPAFTGSTSTFLRADGTWATPTAGAPTTATYITQTPDAGLSNEQALSALATGILKSTTGTGVVSIAGATDYVSPTLFDANTVLAADTDNTPAAVTMGASTILARLAAGNIKAASTSEIRTLLDVPTNAEAILDSIIDAKGDLLAGTAADTVARLAVGANGTVLRADSNTTPGVAWAPSVVPYANWIPASGKIETVPRYVPTSGATAVATGTLRLLALPTPLLAGVTYTSISFINNGAASVPTNWWFCLVRKSDLKTLRSTADQLTTAWGGTELRTVALSSTYTPTVDTDAYLGIMMKATTPVTFRSFTLQTAHYLATPLLVATSNTGMTSPLADDTTVSALTAVAELWWGCVS